MKKKLLAILLAAAVMLSLTACKSSDYKDAVNLLNAGKYNDAELMFISLEDYKDSAKMVLECRYQQAMELYADGSLEEAAKIFKKIADYKDSADLFKSCKYQLGQEHYENGEYREAAGIFGELTGYQDSDQKALECSDLLLKDYLKEGQYGKALPLMEMLDAAGALTSKCNNLAWCKIAAYLEKNEEFTSFQDRFAVKIQFDEEGRGIQFVVADYNSIYPAQQFGALLNLERDEVSGFFYMDLTWKSGKLDYWEKSSGYFNISQYQLGSEFSWQERSNGGRDSFGNRITQFAYQVKKGEVASRMNAISVAVEEMDLGITMQDLGFTRFDSAD